MNDFQTVRNAGRLEPVENVDFASVASCTFPADLGAGICGTWFFPNGS
jgi:hypothetical protein